MARLRFLWVITTTANVADADTDDVFDLIIYSAVNPQAQIGRFQFPDLPNPDERERARTDEYKFDVSALNVDMFTVGPDTLAIRTRGNDVWLPATIWVIGEDVQGKRELRVAIPNWPSSLRWSTDASEGRAERRLAVPLTQ
jgi:hypothetical protein